MATRYAVRLKTTKVKEPDFPYDSQYVFDTSKGVAQFIRSLQDSDVEKFVVLFLSSVGKLNCIQVWEGTVNYAHLYPREIMKHALLSGSSSIILAHNHPSGLTVFSSEDEKLTGQIKELCAMMGIKLLDHVLLGASGSYVTINGCTGHI